MKRTTFRAEHVDGAVERWAFYRDPKLGWFLVTHDGAERHLAETWIDAVPRIRAIADNYGMRVGVS